jgi:DNA-binding GntR family transcriptional regulator
MPAATLPSPGLTIVGDRSLKREVYAVIVALIHRGELRPGDRISEADIAARLGISRAPVREAFSQLTHEGLIVRKPRSASFVAQLSPKDLEDIVDTRILIEGHAARRACARITAADAAELRDLIAEMADSADDVDQWTNTALLNARFHQTVIRIADNEVLANIWQTLHPLLWLLAPAVVPQKRHNRASLVARHQALLAALQNGDPDQAEAAFRDHVHEATPAAPVARVDNDVLRRDHADGRVVRPVAVPRTLESNPIEAQMTAEEARRR